MSLRGKPRERPTSRKVTPPSPSYMNNDQFASYLADLRTNRVARPGGARPLPSSIASSRRDSVRLSSESHRSTAGSAAMPLPASSDAHSTHKTPSFVSRASINPSVAGSVSSRYSTVSGRGRDYYPDKAAAKAVPPPLRPGEVVPTDTYMESGQRWMEKEEAVSLREALEDMDIASGRTSTPSVDADADADEQRIYDAALDEAAELVWQHEHGIKPPEPGAPYRYKRHLRKDSYAHARTASVGRYGNDIEPSGLARDPGSRSVSGSSSSSCEGLGSRRSRHSTGSTRIVSSSGRSSQDSQRDGTTAAPAPTKAYTGLAGGPRPMASGPPVSLHNGHGRRRSSMRRNISGEIEKPFSGDQIYEEPETATPEKAKAASADSVLRAKTENVPSGSGSNSGSSPISKLVSRYEIHRNPPSQSRNPQYTTNAAGPKPNYLASAAAAAPPSDVPRKNGVEIRSEDIRQATSMRLRDRNPKLPTPSYVSDSPGRPIVSFDANWKAPVDDEAATDAQPGGRVAEAILGKTHPLQTSTPSIPSTSTPSTNTLPKPLFSSPTPSPAASMAPHRPAPPAQQPQQQPQQQQQQQPQTRQRPNPFARHAARHQSSAALSSRPSVMVEPRPSVPSITVDEPRRPAVPAVPTISVTEEPQPSHPPVPTIAISEAPAASPNRPPIPSIMLPPDENNAPLPPIPTIVTPDDTMDPGQQPPIPIIVTPDDVPSVSVTPPSSANTAAVPSKTSARPLPTPGSAASRPRGHWSRAPPRAPSSAAGSASAFGHTRATALCHECGYPIEGRFVSLAGGGGEGGSGATGAERFHPQCFRCAACGTSLEALEISPEPAHKREERLASGDGDDRLRFYCHLDWHELFAPRCKHCTTPIVGEHVVALGAHWHVGHFFCAECGDPFGPGQTHIEKDGYAWCVGCQTRRTTRRAPKCRACGEPVVSSSDSEGSGGVRALGAEWHERCFRCGVCGGGFTDGQVFPREGSAGLMQVVCTGCRARELKA